MPHVRRDRRIVSRIDGETIGPIRRTSGVVGVVALAEPPLVQTVESDSEAIARALAGDGEAFGALVTRYERAVYHFAYRMLHDTSEAEDAAQEAFLRAYRSLRTFKTGAKFSTWIFAIVYHTSCDRLERRKRFRYDEMPDHADSALGPQAIAERNDEAERLRTAIAALPDKYRAVITLYHLQDKQYDEIAEVLGLPLGTVKTHLFRAKEQLRRVMSETGAGRVD